MPELAFIFTSKEKKNVVLTEPKRDFKQIQNTQMSFSELI